MKNDVDSLKWAEKGGGGGGVLEFLAVAVLLSLFLAFFVASPGGDDEPGRSTPIATTASRPQQAVRPERTDLPETAVILATLPPSGSARQTSRPQQPAGYTVEPTIAATWTIPATYTPLPTYTAVPSPIPTQTPLPTYTYPPTWTPPASATAVATYTPYPSPTRAVLMVTGYDGGGKDDWEQLVLGGLGTAVVVALGGFLCVLVFYRPQPRVVITNNAAPPPPLPPQLPPQPVLAPVPPVPSTSATGANAPVAPVPGGEGGRLSLKAVPDADKFSQAEIDQLCAIFWRLPGDERTRNRICGEMWGFNAKGEPKKGPNRMAAVDYALRLCQQQERQTRMEQMTIHSGDRTIPLNRRIIRNQPPQPQRRPFVQPTKGIQG